MQRKRSPVPKPTIRHPDRKKETDRMACRHPLFCPCTISFDVAVDGEQLEEFLDAIEVRKAMAEKDTIPWEQVKTELGL